MPSDLLRDADAGRLDLPVDDPDLTDAEHELYAFLNTMDAWSTVSQVSVPFTGVLDPTSVHDGSLVVWLWQSSAPEPIEGSAHLSADGTQLLIDAPPTGWPRGSQIVVALRGGETGVRGARAERVVADAAFYFLRLTEDLTAPEHNSAFPGATKEERAETAAALEEIRRDLAPVFDALEARGWPREEVVSLQRFSVTERVEIAMDKASSRMPLPIDLLRDPVSGLIDIPADPADSELEAHAKLRLRELNGFGPTMPMLFELSAPVDPLTFDETTVQLYDVMNPVEPIPTMVEVSEDLIHLRVSPLGGPLESEHVYVVVVREGVLGATGELVSPMPIGHFIKARSPLMVDGASALGTVADEEAFKLETVRATASAFLDSLGRDGLVAAWPFTTLSIVDPLASAQQSAGKVGVSPNPTDLASMTPTQAALDFPLNALTMLRVGEVWTGKIETVDYLDPITRERRTDGSYEVRQIPFTLTIPNSATAGEPVPVVLFGHGLMAERRFVLGVSDALAARGYAAIAIDLPYHGERTVCKNTGPICVPDPIAGDGSLICPDPCKNGSSCAVDGKCYDDETGEETSLSEWPLIGMYQATGAAFVDVDNIPGTRDHFLQAITDLGALSRAVQQGDWSGTGYTLDPNRIHYVGQSLGGILGSIYTTTDPAVERAVLNVPGGNVVDMFSDSTFFGGHIDAFRERHGIVEGSPEDWRFFAIAHWFMDGADPVNVGRYLESEPMPGVGMHPDRKVLIQMALLDIIIPNNATLLLEDVSGVQRIDYVATHSFLTVPIEPEFLRGTANAAEFVDGGSL